MRTWVAALLQIGTAAAQVAAGVQYFAPTTPGNLLANTGIQMGSQFGLAFLQALIAIKNSNTDPKGNELVQNPLTGGYLTK